MKISNINTCTRRERNKFCFKSRFVHYIQISHTRIYSHRFYTTLLCDLTHDYQHFKYKHDKKKALIIEAQSFYRRAANGQRTPSRALGRIYVNTRTTFDTAVERHKKENMCVCVRVSAGSFSLRWSFYTNKRLIYTVQQKVPLHILS